MSILTILLYIICIILILILICLIIGLKLHIFLDFHEEFYGNFEIYIFKKIKILKKEISNKKLIEKKKDETGEKNKKTLKEKYEDNKDLINEIIANKEPFIEIVKIIKNSIKHSKTEGSIIYGLESPVDTAKIGGFLWTITGILNTGKNTKITVDPIWNEFYLEFTIDTNFEISLLNSIIKILKIIMKNPTRTIVIKLIKMRPRKKDGNKGET